ncbi:MAG: GNAT family N-acetyltransferase [Chitinophagales bacterium]|nr:GNAT family N-acetyltransferase [Chitinophagales bacterium]
MIKLRPILESDLDRIVQLCQDPEISQMTLNVPYPYNMEHARFFYDRIVQGGKSHTLGIHLSDNFDLIGVIGANFNPTKSWAAEIGYWMGKEYRNKGYMTEALKQIIQICFQELKLVRVCACHDPINPASGKVMLNAGMELEGIFKSYVMKDSVYRDSIYYSIINPNI